MQIDALAAIRAKYNDFTAAKKKIADYVLGHPQNVLRMSISEMAEACEAGEATISRFCRDIDLLSYREFKYSIAESLSTTDEPESLDREIRKGDTIRDAARKILSKEIAALNATLKLVDDEKMDRAVKLMIGANRIAFFGVGGSGSIARDMFVRMQYLAPNVMFYEDIHMQIAAASMMTKRDTAIFFSASGATSETVELAEIVKKNGGNVLCITQYLKSPITQHVDITLLYSSESHSMQVEDVNTQLSPYYLVNLLVNEYYRRTSLSSKRNLNRSFEALHSRIY